MPPYVFWHKQSCMFSFYFFLEQPHINTKLFQKIPLTYDFSTYRDITQVGTCFLGRNIKKMAYMDGLRPHKIQVLLNWLTPRKNGFFFVYALLWVQKLGSNKSRLHQPKTRSTWRYLSSFLQRSEGRSYSTQTNDITKNSVLEG